MKFLFISRMKDTYLTLPPEKRAALQLAAFTFADKYSKSGKLLSSYYLSDLKGMVTIWDVANDEEGVRIAIENPINSFVENEIIQLIDIGAARKVMEAMSEAAQKRNPK